MSAVDNAMCAFPDVVAEVDEIIPSAASDGNCRTCWAPLAGAKRSESNPDECEDCAAL